MFGRKDKKAIAALPPQHQQLVNEKQLITSLSPAQWQDLLRSLVHHGDTVAKHPLPTRVQPFIVPLVRVLLEDIPADGYLGVRIDLQGSNAPGKAGPVQQLQVHPPVKRCLQHFDFDPWFAAQARLTNKAKLDIWVADLVRVREITKRSASGKTKQKTKRKASQRVRVRLSIPGHLPVAEPSTGVPGWCRITMAREERNVVLDARSKYPVPPVIAETKLSHLFGSAPHLGAGDVPLPGQLNNVLLLVGEVFRWVPAAGPAEREVV